MADRKSNLRAGGHRGGATFAVHYSASEDGRHRHRMSHIVRGGVVVGLLLLGTGSVACDVLGAPFTPAVQALLGIIGVLSGGVIGAREPV